MGEQKGISNLIKWGTESLVSSVRYEIALQLGLLVLRLYRSIFSIQICLKGLDNIPLGSKILAANHPNVSDALLLPLLFNGKIRAIAQAKSFQQPFIGWILRNTRQIPVLPSRGFEAFKQACRALGKGETILIFPEGRLNPDEDKLKIGSGTVRMAVKTHSPIVPVGIHVLKEDTINLGRGDDPVRKLWQVKGKFFVNIGKPWLPMEGCQEPCNKTVYQELTNCLMEKIDRLKRDPMIQNTSVNLTIGS